MRKHCWFTTVVVFAFAAILAASPQELSGQARARPEMRLFDEPEPLLRPLSGAQLVTTRIVRSKARTAVGTILLAGGGLAAYYGYSRCGVEGRDSERYSASYQRSGGEYDCVLDPTRASGDDVYATHTPNYAIVGAGLGVAALGLALTTIWADVEERVGLGASMAFRPRPRGGELVMLIPLS